MLKFAEPKDISGVIIGDVILRHRVHCGLSASWRGEILRSGRRGKELYVSLLLSLVFVTPWRVAKSFLGVAK